MDDRSQYFKNLPVVYRGAFGNPKMGPDLVFGDPIIQPDSVRGDGFASEQQRQEFETIRRRFDKSLQIVNAHPLMPQANQTPEQYRHSLMQDLLPHASVLEQQRYRVAGSSPSVIEQKLLADILAKPRRENRLAEIQTRDRTGRVTSEFIGAKSAWMNAHRSSGWVMTAVGDTPMSSLRI